MASSPPISPSGLPQRPMSAIMRPPAGRSASRMSVGSKHGGGSKVAEDDGKTSVKVAVRVRPPLRPSDPGFELIPQRFQRSMVQVTSSTGLAVDSPQGRRPFVFDRVFGQDVTQEGVWDYVQESVNAFVQGYNVSVLAYGQSGSGKSYTMGTSGPTEQNDPKIMGVIPRAALALFDKLNAGQATGGRSGSGLRTPTRYSMASIATLSKPVEKDWVLKATYVEIYNEQLRDLLLPESVQPQERNVVAIREDARGRILLTGLHHVTITSIDDLLAALNFGSMIRQTDATAINAKSSRSHAVFSLNLVQRKNKTAPTSTKDKRMSVPLEAMSSKADEWITIDSKLHFVDLAGSERLKNTGAQGERAKEGISINAGLASLGKVISQLSSRHAGSHVSYRDSRLTRLLQDSLGGNAITYMIACVTPAEFHLSETLNTVQYAERARSIQSKPRIQQVSDDSDKQALIDRLRAEVAFLREQIRTVERSEKRTHVPQERSERSNGRERDLQNQLLDIQENYTALSGRHAKLIAEIAKARDTEATQNDEIEGAMGSMGESAVERLKRSNSFAEAVEAVALEYEKTIQSLATSLSSTRSSLSTTENSLLERETKCAAVETLNQHLQARLQKLMDHESSVEHYLHDLEAKLDGHTSGEEKTSAIVIELRKEIARVRENEASCEDYISTLEERLAEADQDVELMQREIQRLEHVVERQRSVGKLDNLLYELDHAAPGVEKDTVVDPPPVNGHPTTPERGETITRTITEETSKDLSGDDGYDTADEARRPSTIAGVEGHAAAEGVAGTVKEKAMLEPRTAVIRQRSPSDGEYPQQSLAQSKFMADKFETVTQELFDLRLEHEGTITELDLISAKYDESLRSLAELQDVVDEQRHPRSGDNFATPASTRPTSFLEDARVSELREGEQISTSRSLSSELFSAGASPSSTEPTEVEGASTRRSDVTRETSRAMTAQDERLAREMEQMKAFQADKDRSLQELAHRYAQLEEIHADTLDIVEELKADVTKAKMNGSTSPTTPVIRRKSSQNVMIIDRAHRSFASLRNLATENFDEKPDVMQNFELNLNTAMHELHSRSERVQELEADIASVKKEMESKMTIISGLTRERSSMKNSSPMDISVVSIMRDQLLRSENQIRMLQETHAETEQGHRAEITRVKTELTARDVSNGKSTEDASRWHDEKSSAQEKRIGELETELSQWEARHQTAMASMKASEKQLLDTIGELETAMGSVEAMRIEQAGYPAESSRSLEMDDAPRMGTEHAALIGSLQRDLDSHRSLVNTHVQRISELEKSHAIAREELGQSVRSREASDADALSHRDLIESLKERICGHEHALQSHQKEVQSLHESHALQLDKAVAGQEESAVRLAEQTAQHEEAMHDLRQQLVNAKNTLDRVLHGASDVLEEQVTADNFSSLLQALRQNRSEVEAQYATAVKVAANAEKELKSLRATVSELTTMNEASVVEIERLNEEYRKSSRIVEELEDQLSSNYDQHQEANNRLSTMEGQRNRQLVEANIAKTQALAELAAVREEISRLEAKSYSYQQNGSPHDAHLQRSNSFNANPRKSVSIASLPSPPPVIPLPPLPTSASPVAGTPPTSALNGLVSSTPPPPSSIPSAGTTSAARHISKDLTAATAHQNQLQLAEEQEARIRTIEKHLYAEKQLTSTLEEALVDLETQGKKVKEDLEVWKKKAWSYEDEIENLKHHQKTSRFSMQAVEEERNARRQAEAAKAQLEERMLALNKKKKKSSLNCF